MNTQSTASRQPLSRSLQDGGARTLSGEVPWYLLAMVVAATSVLVGVIWDISWHKTIGRDTFWTPAHLAIYLGGTVAGLSGGWLALATTFTGSPQAKASTVKLWGFRAPLGAWVAVWGAIAMLTSAPFDDWWHNAYGLDVEILSPPHTVLALGILSIVFGSVLLALAQQNQQERTLGTPLALRLQPMVCAYLSGVFIATVAIFLTEYRWTNQQHAATFYLVSAAVYPMLLLAFSQAVKLRWPATTVAAFYMLSNLVMIWVLPLFAAEPLLAPIFNPLTKMSVDTWPLVLIAPGFACDLVLNKTKSSRAAVQALAAGSTFFLVFVMTQWGFSSLLLSPLGRNWFFAADNVWDYTDRLGDWTTSFWSTEQDPVTATTLAAGWILAVTSTCLGLAWGRFMKRVVR